MHTCIWYIFFSLAFLLLCIIFICSMLFVFLFDLNLVFLQKRRFSHINIHLSNYINYLVLIFFLLNFFVLFWNKTSYIHTHASTHVHMYVCATCCSSLYVFIVFAIFTVKCIKLQCETHLKRWNESFEAHKSVSFVYI